MKNIVLIGMPGSGKTTIGLNLAKELNIDFYDTDNLIEKKEKDTILNIFKKGEGYFRKIEGEIIKEISMASNSVIATGGGTVKKKVNIDRLKENGIVIFIDRNIEDIINDIDICSRPLINNISVDIQNTYLQRIHLYRSFCDVSVDNEGDIINVCGKIIDLIKDK